MVNIILCLKCNKPIKRRQLINGKLVDLGGRKHCLECLPYNNTRYKNIINKCKKCGTIIPNKVKINGKTRTLNSRKYCLNCSPFNSRHFCGPNTTKSKNNTNTKTLYSRKIRKELKSKAIEYKGGKCIKCGYNKCIAALDFHHKDSREKDFRIGGKIVSWEKLKTELDKCILICSNCHRELHFNIDS